MPMAYPLTALATILCLFIYFWTMTRVGKARAQHQVAAPAVTGPPAFERVFRVQQNTMEQLLLFLPALWLFAVAVGDLWAALLGVVWVVGRIVYAHGYYRAAEKRGIGFLITFLASTVAILGTLIAMGYGWWTTVTL